MVTVDESEVSDGLQTDGLQTGFKRMMIPYIVTTHHQSGNFTEREKSISIYDEKAQLEVYVRMYTIAGRNKSIERTIFFHFRSETRSTWQTRSRVRPTIVEEFGSFKGFRYTSE